MAEAESQFEPKLIGFLCNWCTASAADLAGTTRAQYPPNLHPIRVMCSGTVDPVYLIKSLLSGADAVMIGRATLYGLAAGGEAGVRHALKILINEIDRTLGQLGCKTLADVHTGMLAPGRVDTGR